MGKPSEDKEKDQKRTASENRTDDIEEPEDEKKNEQENCMKEPWVTPTHSWNCEPKKPPYQQCRFVCEEIGDGNHYATSSNFSTYQCDPSKPDTEQWGVTVRQECRSKNKSISS